MSNTTPAQTPAAEPQPFRGEERYFYILIGLSLAILLYGLTAFHAMETQGHIITGMNNQVVWGIPHVFAIFMIVTASGVLNIASIGSVFGKPVYKARAPLSGLLSLALLGGGVMVLMLDLGRPDRIIVAATHYNFSSVFSWNVFLYSGMAAIVAVYLWTLMERRMKPWSKTAGVTAFIFRLILTTGTGLIFGFLVARQGYGTAMLAPTFIAMSFTWGLAIFYLVQSAMFAWNGMSLHPDIHRRTKNLLGLFVAATLYFVVMTHLTNLYFAKHGDFERFILAEGGNLSIMLWLGFGLVGSVIPLMLIYIPNWGTPRAIVVASISIIVGAFALLYSFIIGGQAFPLELFPGHDISSTFGDGQIATYVPSLPEIFLGCAGIATAFLITMIGVRILPFLPKDAPSEYHGVENRRTD